MKPMSRSQAAQAQHVFEITEEPAGLEESGMPELERRLGQESLEALETLIFENPAKAFDRLERLIVEHPDIPVLGNRLIITAIKSGADKGTLLRLARENFERAPGYLFHRCELVKQLVDARRIDEARTVFDRYAFLSDFYPDRNQFHVSEVRAFYAARTIYFSAIGDAEGTIACYDLLNELFPDDYDLLDNIGMKILPTLALARAGRPRSRRPKKKASKKVVSRTVAKKKLPR